MLYPHWNAQELPGASPPGPPPGALPLDPTGALQRAPGPHAARLARVARFDFLQFAQALCNQWSTQPSLAHGHPRAKLRHWCDFANFKKALILSEILMCTNIFLFHKASEEGREGGGKTGARARSWGGLEPGTYCMPSDGPGLEINSFTHLQNVASASKIYSLKWNHCSLRLRSKSGPNILILS